MTDMPLFRKTTLIILAEIAILLGTVFIGSCSDSVSFAEYADVNLIEGQDFDYTGIDDGTGTMIQLWTRELDTDNTYMVFEEIDSAAAGTVSGLPDAAAPIYRLEIPNIISNGDFEEDPTSTYWSTEGTADITWAAATDPAVITGRVIDFTHSAADSIKFDISEYLSTDIEYSLRFDIRIKTGQLDNMLFEYNYNDGSGLLVDWSPNLIEYDSGDIINFPLEEDKNIAAFTTTAAGYFSIGWSDNNSGQEGYLDNFRVTRIDQSNALYLDVPFRTDDRPDLLSGGTYTFSVYVKHEDDSQVTPETYNRFRSEGLVMGINEPEGVLSGQTVDISGISPDSWTKVSVSYSDTLRVQIYTPEDPGDSVLTLSIIPTDWNSTNGNTAGSILVSSPELTWTYDS